jgi:hypothetical protein
MSRLSSSLRRGGFLIRDYVLRVYYAFSGRVKRKLLLFYLQSHVHEAGTATNQGDLFDDPAGIFKNGGFEALPFSS